tara:strand:- start:197 stop:445 length:249 start_codon:yes stop_codon:yes gene_type:complete
MNNTSTTKTNTASKTSSDTFGQVATAALNARRFRPAQVDQHTHSENVSDLFNALENADAVFTTIAHPMTREQATGGHTPTQR